MIGQNRIIAEVNRAIELDKLNHFILLIGKQGSGKRTLAKEIAKMLSADFVIVPDTKIDTLRKIIVTANRSQLTMVYIIPELDKASVAAKNSILKFTEELPKNAYVVATAVTEKILSTLLSRAFVWRMGPYTREELTECITDTEKRNEILEICETPGEIELLQSYGVDEFYAFVRKVFDNVGAVPVENVFKIPNNLALKSGEGEKYDVGLFFSAFSEICVSNRLYRAAVVTQKYRSALNEPSINKQMLLDIWLLDIRQALWRDYDDIYLEK